MVNHGRIVVRAEGSLADRSIGELVGGLGHDMGLLVRQELELAKAELREQVAAIAQGAAKILIGAFLAYAGMLAAVAALILGVVALGVTAWLGATIVGVLLLVAGYAISLSGRRGIKRGQPPLQRTRENAKETVQRLKEQLQ